MSAPCHRGSVKWTCAFQNPAVTYGAFTFEVRGELAVSDPDTLDSESLLGRMVTLQVAQLKDG